MTVIGKRWREARQRHPRETSRLHPEIEFRAASIDALPFADGTFDAVVGNFVLHHVGRPAEVLAEAFRVLRPGGKVVHTVWADPSKLEAIGLFFAAMAEHADAAELPNGPLFGVSDFDVFHQMLGDAGVRDSSVRELRTVWRMRTIESFLAAFGDWAQLDAIPTDVRNRIEATVREKAVAYQTSDGFTMPNPAILLSAAR